ncbi:MAG: hypothetical protein LBJ77_02635 [Holosporales bacterium]|jgi:hypothetical protein|nr:hypothetical protein [Holosporales bacterium]
MLGFPEMVFTGIRVVATCMMLSLGISHVESAKLTDAIVRKEVAEKLDVDPEKVKILRRYRDYWIIEVDGTKYKVYQDPLSDKALELAELASKHGIGPEVISDRIMKMVPGSPLNPSGLTADAEIRRFAAFMKKVSSLRKASGGRVVSPGTGGRINVIVGDDGDFHIVDFTRAGEEDLYQFLGCVLCRFCILGRGLVVFLTVYLGRPPTDDEVEKVYAAISEKMRVLHGGRYASH